MSDGVAYKQQLEQAVMTVFTCRSIIKFNSSLSEAQRQDLVSEIDTTLKFLQLRLVANALGERELPPASPNPSADPKNAGPESSSSKAPETDEQSLEKLYKLYHSYLGTIQASNANAALTTIAFRFQEMLSVIKKVQERQSQLDTPSSRQLDEQLTKIKGNVAEIYYIFMEFFRTISCILQANDVHLDTEELPPTKLLITPHETQPFSTDVLAALQQVYHTHLQLKQRKGGFSTRINDTTALLAYLKESLGWELQKHEPLLQRLNTIPALLQDLTGLLGEYEKALAFLFEEEK